MLRKHFNGVDPDDNRLIAHLWIELLGVVWRQSSTVLRSTYKTLCPLQRRCKVNITKSRRYVASPSEWLLTVLESWFPGMAEHPC